jgi:hypothetical protein
MPKLEHTSVPPWVVGPLSDEPDASGMAYLLVGLGASGAEQVAAWRAGLEEYGVRTLLGDDADTVAAALVTALAEARVGVRVRVAGPVGGCLVVRAAALGAGVEDDELHVAATSQGPLVVWCAHCGMTTTAEAVIGDVVPCVGCGRSLLVYHHVSRRTGRFLGYQVDAETVDSPLEVAS